MTLGLAMLFALGCNGASGAGCGAKQTEPAAEPDAKPAARVDADADATKSSLRGTYRITSYRGNDSGCEMLVDTIQAPSFVVVYPFTASSGDVRLGATFCGGADDCSRVASQAGEPAIGYSFLEGTDGDGWTGWGIVDTGATDEKCRAVVQTHRLTTTADDAVRIETKTVETLFEPAVDDAGEQSCRNRDAIDSLTDDLECKAILVTEATRIAEK